MKFETKTAGTAANTVVEQIREKYPDAVRVLQETKDAIPTLWVPEPGVQKVLRYLKEDVDRPFSMLFDLTAIDERLRKNRAGQPESDFFLKHEHG